MAFIDEEGRRVHEVLPLEGMREVISRRMTVSKREYPQGTGSAELEISNILKFRQELKDKGIKVSFGDMYVKAMACAVEEHMEINGSRQNDKLYYYDDININVMASINGVLMQPVLEKANEKDVLEISEELAKTYDYLKRGKLMKVKLDGGTISFSNLGGFMIDDQHPFLSPPQAAIFGVSRNRLRPVYNEKMEIVPANLTLFSLTIDHGFVDGVAVGQFLESFNNAIQDPWTYMYKKTAPKEEI